MHPMIERINELASRYRDGDASAHDDLIRSGYFLVNAMIRRLGWTLGRYGERDDLAQEGILGFADAVERWDATVVRRFDKFAAVCVRRQMITALIAANRKKHHFLTKALSLDKPLRPVGNDPSDKTLGQYSVLFASRYHAELVSDPADLVARAEELADDMAWLEEITRDISELERRSLMGVLLEERSYREVAQELGRTPKSVDNALERAKAKVRREMAG